MMNRNEICHTCQFQNIDEEQIKLYEHINQLVDEADKYAIAHWSQLSRQEQGKWANYINKLREVQHSNINTELPIPPTRIDTRKI